MRWTENDLQKAKANGLKVFDSKPEIGITDGRTPKIKIEKISVEKNTIEFILMSLKQQGIITGFVTEHKFDAVRNYRFDWALLDLKLGIEYEGIFSKKSRHTTPVGFSEDCNKYNLAIQNNWRVLRYTALNYQNLENDLLKIIRHPEL
ncbi:hypothetical protein [Flavobacterium crassostreae]|uniref:DUF559 domain-containing protein n=1 Tax=Flavobacterium crassostreae TaxID=1763534 RepID=A0A1B9E7R4_9FLAO|nr:hypothetical protein [Flavobacterium crassostreae]OCB77982.1 hypothetical protein LPBF_03270 [Flavobacterium crassostreae]